jgi:hypothetical protein
MEIGAGLNQDEHRRIVGLIQKCVGEEDLLMIAMAMRNAFVNSFKDDQYLDTVHAQALLTSCLMVLYINGAIMFREKE